jgi:hypothetical protein
MKTLSIDLTPEEILLVWSTLFEQISDKNLTPKERAMAEQLISRLDVVRLPLAGS